MIDKVDLRVPRLTPFTREFQEVYGESLANPKSPWRSSKYFQSTADMREYGYDVRLHMFSTLTKETIHKLEIYDTGEKTYLGMRLLAERVFDCDSETLGLMRVDLCADVYGVDVPWFKRHALVRHKRLKREFGVVDPYQTIHNGVAQTLYAGRKPNQFRIYNKTAERLVRWKRYIRDLKRDAPGVAPSTFEEMYGHPESEIISRVERQIAAKDLEVCKFSTFRSLLTASEFDPFKAMKISAGSDTPSIEECGFQLYHAGMHLRAMVRRDGIDATIAHMKKHMGRNFYRERKRYEPFLAFPDRHTGVSEPDLFRAYQQSVGRQLRQVA